MLSHLLWVESLFPKLVIILVYLSEGVHLLKSAVLMFGSDMKDSDRPLSEKDLGRTGGRAHACPVSEEDKMAAAKADLLM